MSDSKPQEQRALVPIAVSDGKLVPQTFDQAVEFAKLVAKSSMVPKALAGDVGGVLVAMQMGAELGLSPMAALQNIAVINGRPSLWGDAALAVVLARPDCEDIIEEYDEQQRSARCTVKRRGRTAVVRSFSADDAKRAGLLDKGGPWTQYPKRMLQLRARGFALRDSYPDALRGLAIAEEVRDIPGAIDMRAEWQDALPPEGRDKIGATLAKVVAPEPEVLPKSA